MSDESIVDPYALVLADLRAKRDQIDTAIAAIEGLQGGAATLKPVVHPTAPVDAAPAAPAGAFLGMSIPDATKKLLARERRAMTNPEIWDKLKAGGLHLNSLDPVNTVGSVISRRFDKVGDIVRVGRGTWGLVEWYPGRSFKTAKSVAGDPSRPSDEDLEDLGLQDSLGGSDPALDRERPDQLLVDELLG